MDEPHTDTKKNVRNIRKRKLSHTCVLPESKIQRLDEGKDLRRVEDKDVSPKRRATICSVTNTTKEILCGRVVSWDTFKSEANGVEDKRLCRFNNPLPFFEWSDSFETWRAMVLKETENIYQRDEKLFMRHLSLQPRMRAILLDWLTEVCDVYKMQRKSLYLAIDFVDRYLSRASEVQKKCLQLIGATALFIASKAEEIYPPKLADFSFITDGACTSVDILKQELEMLQVLHWKLTPVTPVCWVACFLQIIFSSPSSEFLISQFEQNLFVRICRLIDLCLLNSESIRFSYYVLGATAVSFYIRNRNLFLKVTVLTADQLIECREWMQPYFNVLSSDKTTVICSSFSNIPQQFAHNVQTHIVNLNLLDAVQETSFSQQSISTVTSDPLRSGTSEPIEGVLTPPKSTELKQKSNQTSSSIDQEEISVKHINLNSN